MLDMMDREYIKGIIQRIVDGNEEKHLSPSNASLMSVLSAVKEDLVVTLRDMCEKREIACNRTINSASFKCL